MNDFELISATGQPYQVSPPAPKTNLKRSYIFAFAKSGSTLLDNMVSTYCKIINIPTFSLFNAAFGQGISTNDIAEDALACIKQEGVIYTGFRHFPAFNLELSGANTILLTRDPRDMLVSMYYSIIKSHVIPEGNSGMQKNRERAVLLDINDYAISHANNYNNHFKRYRLMLDNSDLTTFRYEDVIYEKEKWLNAVVVKLGVEVRPKIITSVAKQFDIIPENEKEDKHIRQVHPGNYLEKLTPDTIVKLNDSLGEFLSFYNYNL
ncbi:MAG: sulfotransferase domain-containing protein [Candidatus Reddybacter sp.]